MNLISDPKHSTAGQSSLDAMLAEVEDRCDVANDPALPPTVLPNPRAMDVYAAIGEADARAPGVDAFSVAGGHQLPSAGTVRASSRAPLYALGESYQRMKAAFEAGTLGLVTASEVPRREAARTMRGQVAIMTIIVLAGAILEVVYGQHAAALLSGAYPDEALAAAVALMIICNGAAYTGAAGLYKKFPGVVAQHGARIFVIIMFLTSTLAVALGLVVGGYDLTDVSGVSGGGAATVDTAMAEGRPLVAFTYAAMLVLVSTAISAGHIHHAHSVDTVLLDMQKSAAEAADAASLDAEAQRRVARTLARSYVASADPAHFQGRRRVAAVNASFRRTASAEVSEAFADIEYDSAEPDWLQDARAFLDELGEDVRSAPLKRVS